MRAALFAVGIGGLAAGLTHSESALACGEAAPPYYLVSGQAPTGAGAPVNTPIVVKLSASPLDATTPAVANGPSLTLTKTGSAVALDVKSVGFQAAPVWVPLAQLEPATGYQARFNAGYEGVADTVWAFTTGTESTPALSLTGKLEVTLEPGTDMVQECITNCGFACVNKGEIAVTKARVKVPRASGGFAERYGTLWLTDDKPAEFFERTKIGPEPNRGTNVSSTHYVNLEDPSVTEVLLTVPTEGVAYKPCFAFIASDARGDQASVEPLCLDAPLLPSANQGTAGNAPTNTEGNSSGGSAMLDPNNADPGFGNDIKSSGTSTSCSLGRARRHDSAGLLLLGPLAVLGAWRRRQGL